ncbi:MAG TPA: DUF3014 domain-containing protein [Vicinamibacterales bacterium]|nr:DUF3014 domain-containing protein [Vicinamibacterales bacterium]
MTLTIDDRDLDKGPEMPAAPEPPAGPPLKPIAIIGVVIVLCIAAGAWWMSRRAQPAQNASPGAVTATDAPIDKPAEPQPPLPPLSEMDGFLRPLLSALSSRPELARWLATDDLVRQLAMAIDQAAVGGTPARDFKVLAPASPFTTTGRGSQRTIDPASYRRYDGLVATVTSIDAGAVAKIYRTIRPRLNEAYRGLGRPDGDVDRALQNAIDILLDTPVVQAPVRVQAIDARGWIYVDPDLEELTPSQKQILRMGPAHAASLIAWLRTLQQALQN